jgi:hypothetical protein
MFTYEIRLAPNSGTAGGNLTTQIRANSDTEARLLVQAQYCSHHVEAVRRIG